MDSPNDEYKPTSRRPIAQLFRATATWPVGLCVRLGIHPDVVSCASVFAAGAAAICFWQSQSNTALLLLGTVLCGVRLWLNMLDGMVALAAGKASLRGEIVNELPDRVSDVLIFAGVAHSGFCRTELGYWTAIMALFTAYVGTLGQAIAGRREFGGLMSKPWRMVVLGMGAVVTWAMLLFGREVSVAEGIQILDITCLVIIAGCLQTIGIRVKRTLNKLAADNENR